MIVGGVPEHFNIPWHYAMEQNKFAQHNISLEWRDYPGGTGAMNKDLREGKLDMAVILTEGIVADIIRGNPSKIVHGYVRSPLVWGIHTGATSQILSVQDFLGKKYAISRFGSGSHLMAYVDAANRNLMIEEGQFRVVNNLDGAFASLSANETDLFLWEKFTTKPYVDKGLLRRVAECPTPWPCFVIAVREEYLDAHKEEVQVVLSCIQEACLEYRVLPDAVSKIALRYNLLISDVQAWMDDLLWQTEPYFDSTMLNNVVDTLYNLNLIDKKVGVEDLLG